jgi:hypothetical protein
VPKKRKPTTQAVIELPRDPERETLEATVALDAIAAGHPDAYKLLEGLPATIGIGSDRYAAEIVRATPSLKTIHVRYTDVHWNTPRTLAEASGPRTGYRTRADRVFRLNAQGRYMAGGCYTLGIGYAEDYSDPHF